MPSCRQPIAGSPATTPRRPGCGRRTPIPGELIGVATGPLTNLALALARRTRAADAVAPAGDHGRLLRPPRQHHSGGRMEHQRGPRGGGRGVHRLVAETEAATPDPCAA